MQSAESGAPDQLRPPCRAWGRGGVGFSSASGTCAKISDQRGCQKRASRGGHRPGRTFRPCGPRRSNCPSLSEGRAHRRRPLPLCPSSLPGSKVPLLLHQLSPTEMSFPGGSCGWAPGCRTLTPTSSSPHNRNHARARVHTHTHTHLPGHTTEITGSTGPSFQSQQPAAHTVALSLQREQGEEREA